MFSKSSLFKIEYSINIETQFLKNIQLYSKPHFYIFTRKKGPLPLLPDSPQSEIGKQFFLETISLSWFFIKSLYKNKKDSLVYGPNHSGNVFQGFFFALTGFWNCLIF